MSLTPVPGRAAGDEPSSQRRSEQQAYQRVALAIAAGSPVESLCRRIAAELVQLPGISAACIGRFDGVSTGTLLGVAGDDLGVGHEPGTIVDLGDDTILGAVARSRKPVYFRPYPESVTPRGDHMRSLYAEAAGVPVSASERQWGGISIARRDIDPAFPDAVVSLLEGFAELLGAAINVGSRSRPPQDGAMLDTIMSSNSAGVTVLDEDLRIVRCNSVARDQYGASANAVVGQRMDQYLPLPVIDSMCFAVDRGIGFSASLTTSRLRTSGSGSTRLTVASVVSESSPGAGLLVLTEDLPDHVGLSARQHVLSEKERAFEINTQVAARAALARNEAARAAERDMQHQAELLRLVTELDPDGVFAVDLEGRILFVNDAAANRVGLSREAIEGRSIFTILPRSTVRRLQVHSRRSLLSGRPVIFEHPVDLLGEATDLLWVLTSYVVDGHTLGVVCRARDVTHHSAGEKSKAMLLARERAAAVETRDSILRLEAQNVHLRDLDRSKDEILALLSHDLRTPLTSMLGYSELLARDRDLLDARQRRFVEIIKRNGERLVDLLDDLLLVAQYQSGGLSVNLEEINLRPLIVQAVDAAVPLAKEKVILITHDIAEDLDAEVDPRRFGQLLDNLVSNAVKYTQEGGFVDVSAVRRDDGWILLRVRDNGPGISLDEQRRIFERFTRARDAIHGGVRGFGLGLTIAHAIANAHGGRIGVDSTPGTGADFWVEIPASTVPSDI